MNEVKELLEKYEEEVKEKLRKEGTLREFETTTREIEEETKSYLLLQEKEEGRFLL